MTKPRYPTSAQLKERRLWGQQFDRCFICREKAPLDVHEIARRSKTNEWCCPENFLATCRRCHDETLSWLPAVVQCALKFVSDEERFDLATINALRHRDEGAVTWGEVKAWIVFLEAISGNRERLGGRFWA